MRRSWNIISACDIRDKDACVRYEGSPGPVLTKRTCPGGNGAQAYKFMFDRRIGRRTGNGCADEMKAMTDETG